MATGCSDSATGILMQLTGVCETSSDELDDDSISIISSTSGSSSTLTSKEAPGSSGTETMDSISNNASFLLLSVLQQAKPSDLCRKRVIRNNLQPKGKKWKVSTTSSSSIKSVSPKDRCLQFSKECFTVSGRKLFCGCCREEVSVKLNHIDSISLIWARIRKPRKTCRRKL